MREQSSFDRELYSNVKMQFYPTDNVEMRKLSGLFDFGEEEACILEPCIGDASAVLAFTQKSKNPHLKIFGVELNTKMYEDLKAKECIDYLINGDFLDIRCYPKGLFSLAFCNPPYGADILDSKVRLEDDFLKEATKCLRPEGLLVWIVPVGLFNRSKSHLKLLSNRYDVLECFKFAEPEFSRFKQVVMICKKKKINSVNLEQEKKIAELLMAVESIPLIPEDEEPRYKILGSTAESVKVFTSSTFNFDEGVNNLGRSVLFDKLVSDSAVESYGISNASPPILPNASQFFTILSVGRANVAEINGRGGKLVQRGTLAEATSSVYDEKKKVYVETTYSKASVCVVEASGKIVRLT